MWRHIASNALNFLIVLTFLIGGVLLWGQRQYTSAGPLADQMCLRVKDGSNMRKVSVNLADQGAVTNGSIFRMGANYSNKSNKLKAGSWLIPKAASMQNIVDSITRGGGSTCGTEIVYRVGVTRVEVQLRELDTKTNRYVEQLSFDIKSEDEKPQLFETTMKNSGTRFRIAVAEGVTSWQIVDALKRVDALEGEITEVPPEGSLSPDSYEFNSGATRSSIIEKMEELQDVRLATVWESRAGNLPLETPDELLILASIIEKETGLPDERAKVASVFINRLRRGMKLQTDPTVIYGVTEGRGILKRGLRQSELRSKTPWNTYIIDGLPPTPIANPGVDSLRAAANPDDTDFIFFVADGSGGHAFAETLAEHNKNVARWRKIEAERGSE
ncbi:FIG004453: protein YceG like [hydrothermal vent metagenome]|uniref:FIG004453: protein YceG like n=1 Tax=hydrothermal vent metagenome TaxID=652676 RepID=A0A3B0RGQ8_9ZZZZ